MEDRASMSIIICTRNRAQSLKETLAAISRVDADHHRRAELLVVDNGSTDQTREVAHATHLPSIPVRYIREERAGKGHAYNAGLAAAGGDILLFTDDDVRPVGPWLWWHAQAYDNPSVVAVQGRIELQFESPPPWWLCRVHRAWLAEFDHGPKPIMPFRTHLVGANMSFRRAAALRAGGFNPLLGPGKCGFWDDSEFSARLMKAGGVHRYEPRAVVRHVIPAARLSSRYFRDVAFRSGVSAYVASKVGMFRPSRNPYWQFACCLMRQAKWELGHLMLADRPTSSEMEIRFHCELGALCGHLMGYRRLMQRHHETPAAACIPGKGNAQAMEGRPR